MSTDRLNPDGQSRQRETFRIGGQKFEAPVPFNELKRVPGISMEIGGGMSKDARRRAARQARRQQGRP